MDTDRYLEHLRADAARLADAARASGLAAKVPTCPEWDVTALVEHVGAVYAHKIECMRLRRRPEEWTKETPAGTDPVDWLTAELDTLVGELVSRGPDAPAYTWYPPDQTVGFWYRRMAQETVVHRVDAEAAAGHPSVVDDDIALDGIDEMLRVFLGGPWWEEEPEPAATGSTYAITAAGETWRVTLQTTAVTIARGPGDAVAEVTGMPYDVLMWVWGRPSSAAVSGDVTELRERLAKVSD